MSVEVLLIDQVDGLGIEGDIVKVADGYARNYLFPNGYATLVTEGKRRQIEKRRAARLIEIEEAKGDAEILSKKIAEIVLQISVKVGENGKMFGSVGIPQLAEHLAAEGIVIERSMFKLHQPISKLGEHEIKVVLHPEVNTNLKFKIVEE
jgi:large subunit ribosomal protein L9